MSKLVIIDGHAIMYRSFHALPPLTTRNGEPINAVYGLVSMLLKVITDLKPSHLVVTFDEKAKTFRQKELPTYQAQRPPMVSELSSQFAKAKDFLVAANIPVYSKPGYEADDVIGTIADRAVKGERQEVKEVVIVTGDRDQLQLIDDKQRIKLYMPVVGLSNAKLYGEAETVERMGVPPTQIADLKALTGDASDNYFGVPGIGPKTATTLLSKYRSVKEIYNHLDEISEKVREKLEKGKASADQSYMLATIVRDVSLDLDFEVMKNWKLDSPQVLKLFEEFGFKTLTARIKKVGEDLEKEKQGSLF
jgi:DNA polymerase I